MRSNDHYLINRDVLRVLRVDCLPQTAWGVSRKLQREKHKVLSALIDCEMNEFVIRHVVMREVPGSNGFHYQYDLDTYQITQAGREFLESSDACDAAPWEDSDFQSDVPGLGSPTLYDQWLLWKAGKRPAAMLKAAHRKMAREQSKKQGESYSVRRVAHQAGAGKKRKVTNGD